MSFLKRLLARVPVLYFIVFAVRNVIQIISSKELIIITTPGHVGSSTVFRSLKNVPELSRCARIFDIHSLRERFNNKLFVNSISQRHVLQEVLRFMLTQKWLTRKRIFVISVVRDPVARALGGMFQNSRVFIKNMDVNQIPEAQYENACGEIYHQFVNGGHLLKTTEWQLSFYKSELLTYWNFNLEGHNFKKGNVLHHGNHKMILLTLENLEVGFADMMKQEFGVSTSVIVSNRNSNLFYKYCKTTLKFDSSLLKKIYADPFFEKVYGNEKVSEMFDYWLEK